MPGISERFPVAVLGGERRHRRRSGRRVETRTLIIDEEEELVLFDGTAQRRAEFVPSHVRRSAVDRRIGAEVARPLIGVEKIVAQKFERVAMKLVTAGLDADADDAAQELAEIGAGIVRDDVKLLDRVDAGRIRDVVVHELVVVHAVQQVVIGLLAVAVDVGPARVEREVRY